MKILLVRPPISFYQGSIPPMMSIPIGLLSIAALLERTGFSVEIYDAQVNLNSPISEFDDEFLMGDSWEIVNNIISNKQADVVGISCGFSTQLSNTLKLARIVRDCLPNSIIITGGPHASVMPSDLLNSASPINLVCIGEGEATMLDLIQTVSNKGDISSIPGTASWTGNQIRYNPLRPHIMELDDLPFPAYHLVEMEHYFRLFETGYYNRPTAFRSGFNRAVSVVTSRGCPFNCIFCSIHLHMGKKWRGNSADYISAHIDILVNKYNVKHIHFEDDNISYSRARFEKIINKISNFNITWDTPNGIRVDTLSEPLVKACKQSGCTYLVFGVESGNQNTLNKIIDKKLDLSAVKKAAAWCKNFNLDSMAFYVIGFPGESANNMRDTTSFALDLYRKFDVKPYLFVATPLPGTRLEKVLIEQNIIDAPLNSHQLSTMTQGNFLINAGSFSSEELNQVLEEFHASYRNAYIFNTLKYLFFNPFSIIRFFGLFMRVRSSMSLKNKLIAIFKVKRASLGSSHNRS